MTHHSVLAVVFSFIESFIRFQEDLLSRKLRYMIAETKRHRDLQYLTGIFEAILLNRGTNTFQNDLSALAGCFRKDQEEFLTAPAAHSICGTNPFQEYVGDGFEHIVPSVVAISVVDRFEVVDIRYGHGEATSSTDRTLDFLFDDLIEGTPVVKPGQSIVPCEPLQI